MDETQALELYFPILETNYLNFARCEKSLISAAKDHHISCFRGCGACCHFPLISATAGEAFVLLNILKRASKDFTIYRDLFLNYASRYIALAKQAGSLPFTSKQATAFVQERLPCPLFRAESDDSFAGECSIFSARPLICGYFHSLDHPRLCETKQKHATLQELIDAGLACTEDLLAAERSLFGVGTLGHLPILLAALSTTEGMTAFLNAPQVLNDCGLDKKAPQDVADFMLYVVFLRILGYEVGESDLKALETAQVELHNAVALPEQIN